MPELARFYGIVIAMYWRDHHPPHFHVFYGEHEAEVDLEGNLLAGGLPKRAHALVMEWWTLHRQELKENWQRAEARQALRPIAPLE